MTTNLFERNLDSNARVIVRISTTTFPEASYAINGIIEARENETSDYKVTEIYSCDTLDAAIEFFNTLIINNPKIH